MLLMATHIPFALSTSVPPAPLPKGSTRDPAWGPSLATSTCYGHATDQKFQRIKISQEQGLTND